MRPPGAENPSTPLPGDAHHGVPHRRHADRAGTATASTLSATTTRRPERLGPPRGGRWRSLLLAPSDAVTRRRGSDAVRLVLAGLAVVVTELAIRAGPSAEASIERFVHPPPGGIQWLVTAVWYAGSLGLMAAVVVIALLARRRHMARDAVLAGLAAWAVCGILGLLLGATGGRPVEHALAGVNQGFPLARIATTVAVVCAVRPYLCRSLQRLLGAALVLVSVATLVNGAGLLLPVFASLAIGWGVTSGVRLAFGSPLGLPSADDVAASLEALGLEVHDVVPEAHQVWGVARYRARDEDGALGLSVYGRDAADAQMLAKAWRFLVYRDAGPTLTLTRLQQVEHEAYLTLLAGRSGAVVPEVVSAGRAAPSGDAVLCTRPPPGRPLADVQDDQVGDDALRDALGNLMALRRAKIAHGALSGATILLTPDHKSALVDFRCASSSAPEDRLDVDVATALASLALVVGVERVVAAATSALSRQVLVGCLPYLQTAAMNPVAAKALRHHKDLLTSLRTTSAEAAGVPEPKLTEPRRVSPTSLVFALGTLIGGWALIGVLVNVTNSFSTIAGARWGWVVGVALLSQLVYVGNAIDTVGSVTGPLPFARVLALEVGNSFTSLAAGTMGVLAIRVRFFQKEGYPATVAVSSGVLASTASWIVKGALFLVALPMAWGDLHFDRHPGGGSQTAVWLLILVLVGATLALGVLLVVPRLRRLARDKLRPRLSDVMANLKDLAARPRKLVQVFGGCLAAQLLVALALGAALHAFGDRLPLATLLVVLTLASMIGGVSPVPGGMGVVEAGMIAGLTAAGVPQTDAVAAVFVQRLFTSYLPPIWGWFVLNGMRRREFV